jgi:hypothetical protein
MSVMARLTTSAVVANRFVAFQIDDGAGSVMWKNQPETGVASQTLGFPMYPGAGGQGQGNQPFQMAMPSMILLPGWRFASTTTGLDAADQWDQIVVAGYPE